MTHLKHSSTPPAARRAPRPVSRRPARRSSRQLLVEALESRLAMDGQLADLLPRFGSQEALHDYLLKDALTRYAPLFGEPGSPYCWGACAYFDGRGVIALNDTSSSGSANSTLAGSSSTNVQVAGVDEGDIVEVDNSYLYVLHGNQVAIVAAQPATDPQVVARLDVPGAGIAEYLYGDRLTVISSENFWGNAEPLMAAKSLSGLRPLPFSLLQSTVTVTVFDVSDRSAPHVTERTVLDGSYRDSRMIDDKVVVVLSNANIELPAPELICDSTDALDQWPPVEDGSSQDMLRVAGTMTLSGPLIWIPGGGGSCVYESKDSWLTRIEPQIDSIIADLLPHYTSYGAEEQVVRAGLLHEAADLVRPVAADPSQLLSLVSFDVDDQDPGVLAAEGIATGWTGQVYASRDAFVVSDYDAASNGMRLLMYQWDAELGAPRALATGVVPGSIGNSFSLDEHGGYIRAATTRWEPTGPDGRWLPHNYLSILQPVDGQLTLVGQLTDFGTDESIQSVRFVDDLAFVVTFRQTDPLFTIDLSDPLKPHLIGELQIPGFSGYLQKLSDTRLLGIGYGPDSQNKWVSQLSLFDITDLAHPARVAVYDLPQNTWTAASTDPHALLWDPASATLAFPYSGGFSETVTLDDGTPSWMWQARSGLDVLHLDLNAKPKSPSATDAIELRAQIIDDAGMVRSAVIGDSLYAVGTLNLTVVPLATPQETLAKIPLFAADIVDITPIFLVEELSARLRPAATDGSDAPAANVTATPTDDGPIATLLSLATDDLATRRGVPVEQIHLVTIEGARWLADSTDLVSADGELLANTVDGYQIVLADGAQRFLYDADIAGRIQLVDDNYQFVTGSTEPQWHNIVKPLDVTNDGFITPQDVLVIVNELNSVGGRELQSVYPMRSIHAPPSNSVRWFWDVNGDNYLTPLDALQVINVLNESPSGEGELTADLLPTPISSPAAAMNVPSTTPGLWPVVVDEALGMWDGFTN